MGNKIGANTSKSILRGIVLIIIGAILLIAPVKRINERDNASQLTYEQAMEEYAKAYDEWHEQWWNGNADAGDAPEMPIPSDYNRMPVFDIVMILGAIVLMLTGGIVVLSSSATNSFKKSLNSKEVLDFIDTIEDTIENSEVVKSAKDHTVKTRKCENCGATTKGGVCEYCGK